VKVLVSGRYLGGAGGLERALFSSIVALQDDQVDVVVSKRLGGPWGRVPPNATVFDRENWRWRGASRFSHDHPLNIVRRNILPKYDVVLQQKRGQDVTSTSRASMRLLIPAGNTITEPRPLFDYVALESPDNITLVGANTPTILLPPPVLPLSERAEKPQVKLPTEYFLTVFNPYSPVKGVDDLARAADSAPLPIVWCHSDRTLTFEIDPSLIEHRNIIHVSDADPSELRYLYEGCAAYLSFSRSEGFGWSIADALRYSRSIVSREVGVLSFRESHQDDVHLIGEVWDFNWSKIDPNAPRPTRDLSFLSADRFRATLHETLASADLAQACP